MRVLIFAYDFPHWKSAALIRDTVASGHQVVGVAGAPFVPMRGTLVPPPETGQLPETRQLCRELGLKYAIGDHNDVAFLAKLTAESGATVGLVAGAKILREAIIFLFPEGIVNYHPGRIPETSGLDSLYYSILRGVPPCVTAHLIDKRVDAGTFIGEWQVALAPDDTMASIKQKLLERQITINRVVLSGLERHAYPLSKIDRPAKNHPLSPAQKLEVEKQFPAWLQAMMAAGGANPATTKS